ncbi:DUF3530 family protein [Thalassotalea sediminis]|uniref:DUF3530 family protein n=1 Tax=Thalassotalea sediminis TaxID=1759089 RepID=UPI002573EF9F|nr:DUF3530 family protein [Thalassotalea sediminis]
MISRHKALLFIFLLVTSTSVFAHFALQESNDSTPVKQEEKVKAAEKEEQPQEDKEAQNQKPVVMLPKALKEIYELDLKHYLPDDNFDNLMVGSDTHLALVNTHDSQAPKGVAILIPEWQQPATSPQAINELRQRLPKYGWTTISLQPIAKPENYPSIATEKSAKIAENKQALVEYRQQLALLLTAALEKAKSFPGIIIIVAQGQNAAQVITLLAQNQIDNPAAFIMLSAYMPTDEEITASANQLANLSLPVFDLYLKADHFKVPQNASVRHKKVKQMAKSQYRQTRLFNFNTGYYDNDALIKQINGWLTSIGW